MSIESYQRQAALAVIQDRRTFIGRWNDEEGLIEVLGLDGSWHFYDLVEIPEIAKWRYAASGRSVTTEGQP